MHGNLPSIALITGYTKSFLGVKDGVLKQIKIPPKDEKLAEFVGIMLGDGNIFLNKDVAQVRVSANKFDEQDFILNFVKPLIDNLFDIKSRVVMKTFNNDMFVAVESKSLVEFLLSIGLASGNKIKNQVTIPNWIKSDLNLLTACVRGLIDTDGSVFRMSRKDFDNPRIDFKNFNKRLLENTREAFIKLGFHPSKIITNNHFFLSRLDEVKRFSENIKFHNPKHTNRLIKIAPSSSGQESQKLW